MTITPLDDERVREIDTISRLLDNTLDRVVNVYAQAGMALPDRRYWTVGPPAVDCEQVVVVFLQAYIGPPGDIAATPQRCDGPRSATLQVQIHRCIPTVDNRGRAPSADAIQGGALGLVRDGWLLLDCAKELDEWGLGVVATIDHTEPAGGFQATVLQLTMAIP